MGLTKPTAISGLLLITCIPLLDIMYKPKGWRGGTETNTLAS